MPAAQGNARLRKRIEGALAAELRASGARRVCYRRTSSIRIRSKDGDLSPAARARAHGPAPAQFIQPDRAGPSLVSHRFEERLKHHAHDARSECE
jgi:hypothetical protein